MGSWDGRVRMLVVALGDLGTGSHLSGTAAARGDGLTVLGLLAVIALVVALMGAIGRDKGKRFSPGEKAPRTGKYEAKLTATAYSGEGRTLPPPKGQITDEDGKWRLVDAHTSERWLGIAILLCVLGALCYSQLNIPRMEKTVGQALGVATPQPPPPTRYPSPVRHFHGGQQVVYEPHGVRQRISHRLHGHQRSQGGRHSRTGPDVRR
jgi:hypothetical protein